MLSFVWPHRDSLCLTMHSVRLDHSIRSFHPDERTYNASLPFAVCHLPPYPKGQLGGWRWVTIPPRFRERNESVTFLNNGPAVPPITSFAPEWTDTQKKALEFTMIHNITRTQQRGVRRRRVNNDVSREDSYCEWTYESEGYSLKPKQQIPLLCFSGLSKNNKYF